MRGNFLSAVLAATLVASGAGAATVTITGTSSTVTGTNDFAAELATAGYSTFIDSASFKLNSTAKLTFSGIAAESGYDNTFTVAGLGAFTESGGTFGVGSNFLTASIAAFTLTQNYLAGSLDSLFKFTSSGSAAVGSAGSALLGVFTTAGNGDYSTFFLAFDDLGAGPDDNHDDFIVRVDVEDATTGISPIPLPAGLPLMLAGLGLFGLGARLKSKRSA